MTVCRRFSMPGRPNASRLLSNFLTFGACHHIFVPIVRVFSGRLSAAPGKEPSWCLWCWCPEADRGLTQYVKSRRASSTSWTLNPGLGSVVSRWSAAWLGWYCLGGQGLVWTKALGGRSRHKSFYYVSGRKDAKKVEKFQQRLKEIEV